MSFIKFKEIRSFFKSPVKHLHPGGDNLREYSKRPAVRIAAASALIVGLPYTFSIAAGIAAKSLMVGMATKFALAGVEIGVISKKRHEIRNWFFKHKPEKQPSI